MPELPFSIFFAPEVRRAELIAQCQESLRCHPDIVHHLTKVLLRKFAVKSANKPHAFFSSQMPIPNLLGRIIGRPTNPKLNEGCVVVKPIDLIIQTVVLAVRSFSAFRIRFESRVFNCVVIALLWCSLQVIAEIVNFDLGPFKFLIISG